MPASSNRKGRKKRRGEGREDGGREKGKDAVAQYAGAMGGFADCGAVPTEEEGRAKKKRGKEGKEAVTKEGRPLNPEPITSWITISTRLT